MDYDAWCRERGVTHAHCPEHCEHPQPLFVEGDSRLLCGRCLVLCGLFTEMVPCDERTCPEG